MTNRSPSILTTEFFYKHPRILFFIANTFIFRPCKLLLKVCMQYPRKNAYVSACHLPIHSGKKNSNVIDLPIIPTP